MGLDGSFRHHHGIGNLAVGFALSNEPHNPAFTLREPAKGFFGSAVGRSGFFAGQRAERVCWLLRISVPKMRCCPGYFAHPFAKEHR